MFQHVSTCFYWTTFDGHTEFPFEIKKRTAKCNHIYFPFFLTRIGFRPRLAKLHSFHPQVLFSRVLLGLRGLTGFFFTVLPCSCDVYTAFIGFHWRMWCGSRGHRRCGCRGERGGGTPPAFGDVCRSAFCRCSGLEWELLRLFLPVSLHLPLDLPDSSASFAPPTLCQLEREQGAPQPVLRRWQLGLVIVNPELRRASAESSPDDQLSGAHSKGKSLETNVLPAQST